MVNILARILDSERNVNGFADPMITAHRGFIQILGPDCGFWLLGSSDRGSQRSPGNLNFFFLRAGCPAVEKMTTNSNALKRDGSVMADSDLVDFLSGSTDSAINFSRSADLHTPIHPPLGASAAGDTVFKIFRSAGEIIADGEGAFRASYIGERSDELAGLTPAAMTCM